MTSLLKLKTNKTTLLKAVREIISEELTKSYRGFMGSIAEKRQNRKLKVIRKELDRWITEMEVVDGVKESEPEYAEHT